MKHRSPLIIAQLLGLFPVQGLWRGKSWSDLEFKKCSVPLIYSLFTVCIRIFAKLLFFALVTLAPNILTNTSRTDLQTMTFGFFSTFCTGIIFQPISLFQTRACLELLKTLEHFDGKYPPKHKNNPWGLFLCPFLLFNFIYQLMAVAFPVSLAVGLMFYLQELAGDEEEAFYLEHEGFQGIYANSYVNFTTVNLGTLLVLFVSETASFFPVLQISYFVRALENRLENIYRAMQDYDKADRGKSNHQRLHKTFLESNDKGLYTQLSYLGTENSFGKASNEKRTFWKDICQQYLDFIELHTKFSKFSGLHFIILYPVQIVAAFSMIYLEFATEVFERSVYVEYSIGGLILMSLVRLWGMCNLGHRLEKVHEKMLKMLLEEDGNKIRDIEEHTKFKKFLKVMKAIPIQLNAMGYFTIGRNNIPGIIGAVVSYIIILFQFKQSERPAKIITNVTEEAARHLANILKH